MNRTIQLILIYAVVLVLSAAMIVFFINVGRNVPEAEMPIISDPGKVEVDEMFRVTGDMELTNQEGVTMQFSDIEGKVTLVAEFFAVCPHCAVRNGKELGEIYKKFRDHPDFRILCISVDPETDGVNQLKAYGLALEADPENWWFARGESEEETHRFLEEELKFFKIKQWKDPVDIASHGRFSHDMGFLLVDRDLNVIGKWPLVDARSPQATERDPSLYGKLKLEMLGRIEEELKGGGQAVDANESEETGDE